MAQYHVGCECGAIYAGPYRKNKTDWRNKSNVTGEAINAVALYLAEYEQTVNFKYLGKWYRLSVTKAVEE